MVKERAGFAWLPWGAMPRWPLEGKSLNKLTDFASYYYNFLSIKKYRRQRDCIFLSGYVCVDFSVGFL